MNTKLLYSLTLLIFFFCITNAQTIPEAAREKYIIGITLRDQAKSASDYDLPITKFKDAISLAPTWADAYKELGLTLELAGQFDDAITNLNKYISLNPPKDDERKAQDEIYIIKAKKEKAIAVTETQNFEGVWNNDYTLNGSFRRFSTYIKYFSDNKKWKIMQMGSVSKDEIIKWESLESQDKYFKEIALVGTELQFKKFEYTSSDLCATFKCRITLSNDGNKLTLEETLQPFESGQLGNCPYQSSYGNRNYVFIKEK